MILKKCLVFVLLILTFSFMFAEDFPRGSALNFNPAYMVINQKWSVSYESYFEGKEMNFVVFQPFKDGFAGKIGVYADNKTNGIVYSVASVLGKTSAGVDFNLCSNGTSVSIIAGLGTIQKVWENLSVEFRIPKALTYVYNRGMEVHPNFDITLSALFNNFNFAGFAGVEYPWVKGGAWGSFSSFGMQVYGYYETGYDVELSSAVNEQKLDAIIQYSVGNMKFAYIYENYTDSFLSNVNRNGLRVSIEW